MVTVSGYKVRQNAEGKDFCVLLLLGGIELVKSSITNQYYATARKASITSTLPEEVCKNIIGTKLPGAIERQECEAYEYALPETGEVVTLNHRYVYNPKPNTPSMEETVFAPEMAVASM